jgi:cohesin loading factor subunit SCC2
VRPSARVQAAWLTAIVARLRTHVERPGKTPSAAETQVVAALMCITSLLVEHCDFDKLRDEETGSCCRRDVWLRADRAFSVRDGPRLGVSGGWTWRSFPSMSTDVCAQHCIIDHVYEYMLDLYEKYESPALKGRALLCLGVPFPPLSSEQIA